MAPKNKLSRAFQMICLEVESYKTQRRCKPTRYRYMMQDIQGILIQSENLTVLISATGHIHIECNSCFNDTSNCEKMEEFYVLAIANIAAQIQTEAFLAIDYFVLAPGTLYIELAILYVAILSA